MFRKRSLLKMDKRCHHLLYDKNAKTGDLDEIKILFYEYFGSVLPFVIVSRDETADDQLAQVIFESLSECLPVELISFSATRKRLESQLFHCQAVIFALGRADHERFHRHFSNCTAIRLSYRDVPALGIVNGPPPKRLPLLPHSVPICNWSEGIDSGKLVPFMRKLLSPAINELYTIVSNLLMLSETLSETIDINSELISHVRGIPKPDCKSFSEILSIARKCQEIVTGSFERKTTKLTNVRTSNIQKLRNDR